MRSFASSMMGIGCSGPRGALRAIAFVSLGLSLGTTACTSSAGNTPDDQNPGYVAPGDGTTTTSPSAPSTSSVPAAPATASETKRTPPAISGGTLLVLRDGHTAFASDPDRDQLHVVDLVSHAVKTIALQPNDEPGRAVEDADGRVHVALRHGGALLTVDPRGGQILNRRAVCNAPRGVAVERGTGLVHVACAGGELVTLTAMGAEPVRSLQLDRDLRDVAVAKNGSLLVTVFRRAELLVVGADGHVGSRLRPPQTFPASLGFGGKAFDARVPLPSGGFANGGLPNSTATPAVGWKLVMDESGGRERPVMIHQRGADVPLGSQSGGYVSQGCGGFVEGAVSSFNPETGEVKSSPAITNVVLPVDVAVSPSGGQLAIVAAGNGALAPSVQFVRADAPEQDPTVAPSPCLDPSSVPFPEAEPVVDGDLGERLPAPAGYHPPNGEVIAVAYDPKGNVIVQSREPATLQILTQQSSDVVLSRDSRLDVGHRTFHGATKGQLACASCHPEGGDDARVWNFATIGPRRTQNLRGGIMQTAPFHWDGDMKSFGHLMTEVFQNRMQGDSVDAPRLNALAAWLDRVPRVKIAARDADAVARGRALFNNAAVGCATCHAGPHLTNNTTVDVGTGGLFQVPQLQGLALRAPFMHDGCAGTLADRFTKCGGGDRHGKTSQLTQPQIADLVSYLETL